jgi:TRAP-type uncharacterized transport system substrate-binding protein
MARDFSRFQNVEIGSGAQEASYTMGTGDFSAAGYAAGVKLPTSPSSAEVKNG